MNGLKALVADDDPITRAVVARPLLQWGFEVATATDGAIAWQYLETVRWPDAGGARLDDAAHERAGCVPAPAGGASDVQRLRDAAHLTRGTK